jgi:hypothetical protein
MSQEKNYALDDFASAFVEKQKSSDRKGGLNPANHNTETKRYAKLSLSLTNDEKQKIQDYKDVHYPRTSISSMILAILEKEGVFDESN